MRGEQGRTRTGWIAYSILLVCLMGCTVAGKTKRQLKSLNGTYQYKDRLLTIDLVLRGDTAYSFSYDISMNHRSSSGVYKRTSSDTIVLNSIYKWGNEALVRITWKKFIDKKLVVKKNKIYYEDFVLKRIHH